MHKHIGLVLFASLLFACGVTCAELRIVAATNDIAAIAQAVGGDRVSIDVVARPDRDPHTVSVRPSTMRMTAKADLFLRVGLDLDLWSEDIVRGSRNRDLRTIDCSQAIQATEIPQGKVDASMGDVHPQGNPHYWLDPINGIAVAHFLAQEFSTSSPQDRELFQANARHFEESIRTKLPTWEIRLAKVAFVEYHRSWVYLAARFDMTIVGQVEPLPGIPPTARHLAELSAVIAQTGARVVVRDQFHNDSPVDFLQRETGIQAVILASMCAEPTAESYLAHFDTITDALGSKSTKKSPGAQ